MKLRLIRRAVIGVVALHSIMLGTGMMLRPALILRMAGMTGEEPGFFAVQTGVLLFILGCGYAAAIWYRPFAFMLIGSKAVAVVFLAVSCLAGKPSVLLLSALVDGVMCLAVTAVVVTDQLRSRGGGRSCNTEQASATGW